MLNYRHLLALMMLHAAMGHAQEGRNLGVLIFGEGGLNPYSRTDVHDLANSLTDSTLVVQVDSTKGSNVGLGVLFIYDRLTVEMTISTIPSIVMGNGDFSAKYTSLRNNTSVKTDSLDLFMMYSHAKLGVGYMFNNGGLFFIAPNLNYDAEAGRMIVKDELWRRYNYNNHFTYTSSHNGVQIDSLRQDKSTIRGVSLGMRTGVFIGRGWESGLSIMLSVAPYVKYGWRVNTNLLNEKTVYPGRWSMYALFNVGFGWLLRE